MLLESSAREASAGSYIDRLDDNATADIRQVVQMEEQLRNMARHATSTSRENAITSSQDEAATLRAVDGSYVSEASIMKELIPEISRTSRTNVKVHGEFIDAIEESHQLSMGSDLTKCTRRMIKGRRLVQRFLRSPWANSFLGIVIFFDVVLSCNTIDSNAKGQDPELWVSVGSFACFAVYVTELGAVLFSRRMAALSDGWVRLDIVIVLGGSADVIGQSAGMESSGLGIVRLLRLLRVVRLVSMLRKITFLKELRKLARMLVSCIKTLLWSFLFCFMCMTFWAMLAVDLLHPIMQDMIQQGYWPGCLTDPKNHYCDAFSSIMRANLTLFKTIVAGDSWGTIAEPMIAVHPWTAIIFTGSLMTIVFAVLNLVVAAVVDEFAEQRLRDVNSIAQEMEESQQEDLKFLAKVFEQIDEDGSGELSLQELIDGARKVPEFRSRLRVMDIDQDDLQQLFYMLDEDLSGAIAPEEFIYALSRWLNESKTASRFVKYNVMRSMNTQNELLDFMRQRLDRIDKQLRHVMTSQKDINTEVQQLHQDMSEAGSNAGSNVSLEATSQFGENALDCQAIPSPGRIAAQRPAHQDERPGLRLAQQSSSSEAPRLAGLFEASQEHEMFVDSLQQMLRGAQETFMCSLQTARLALAESVRAEVEGEQQESLAALEQMVQMLSERLVINPSSRNQIVPARGTETATWLGNKRCVSPSELQNGLAASQGDAEDMLRVLV
eukprot:TRINITY_DN2717_c0_g2_i1.p1 TRINITY_DN2717_c0_g2~~TRINITY_DN2717_c0_g2_i1.p1  ORF type:complete len:739 (-),score=146.66 TRINITY_DN2717_c0_g2_i1:280-2445(-)